MELNDIFTNVEVLRSLATVAAAAVLIGITAIVAAFGTHKVVSYLKLAWINIRSKIDIVIDAVDQDTDPVNMKIDTVLDRLVAAEWNKIAAGFLPGFLRAVADGLDQIVAPPQEINITAPTSGQMDDLAERAKAELDQ